MDGWTVDRSTLLPRSGLGVVGPWLVMAPENDAVIRIDLRGLDSIAIVPEVSANLDGNGMPVRSGCQLLLVCGDLEVAVHVADGPEAAARIVQAAAPHTRAGKTGDAIHGVCNLVMVDSETVCLRREYLQIGNLAFRIIEVREYAMRGQNIPLTQGRLVQAAMALLVVAAEERDSTK
jgi:hypothetical protein